MKTDFRSIRNETFDPILPPEADPKRKRGGRVKRLDAISGAHARHRLDRRARR